MRILIHGWDQQPSRNVKRFGVAEFPGLNNIAFSDDPKYQLDDTTGLYFRVDKQFLNPYPELVLEPEIAKVLFRLAGLDTPNIGGISYQRLAEIASAVERAIESSEIMIAEARDFSLETGTALSAGALRKVCRDFQNIVTFAQKQKTGVYWTTAPLEKEIHV